MQPCFSWLHTAAWCQRSAVKGCAAAARNQPTRLKHNTFSLKAPHPSVPAHIESCAGVTDGAQGVPLQMFCRTFFSFFTSTPLQRLRSSWISAALRLPRRRPWSTGRLEPRDVQGNGAFVQRALDKQLLFFLSNQSLSQTFSWSRDNSVINNATTLPPNCQHFFPPHHSSEEAIFHSGGWENTTGAERMIFKK